MQLCSDRGQFFHLYGSLCPVPNYFGGRGRAVRRRHQNVDISHLGTDFRVAHLAFILWILSFKRSRLLPMGSNNKLFDVCL